MFFFDIKVFLGFRVTVVVGVVVGILVGLGLLVGFVILYYRRGKVLEELVNDIK